MKKYKQTIIPETIIPKLLLDANRKELNDFVKKYYIKYIKGSSVTNKHLNLIINFTSQGKSKIIFGSALYPKKLAVTMILKKLLEIAVFSNFGLRKKTDPLEVCGYLNFKAKCKIDGKIEFVNIAVKLMKNNKIYYSHETVIKKIPTI